jgi:hypothetical protein
VLELSATVSSLWATTDSRTLEALSFVPGMVVAEM